MNVLLYYQQALVMSAYHFPEGRMLAPWFLWLSRASPGFLFWRWFLLPNFHLRSILSDSGPNTNRKKSQPHFEIRIPEIMNQTFFVCVCFAMKHDINTSVLNYIYFLSYQFWNEKAKKNRKKETNSLQIIWFRHLFICFIFCRYVSLGLLTAITVILISTISKLY